MSNPFSTIVVDVKKFFANTGSDVEKLAASFWKIFKKAPTALQTVDNFVTEAGGVVIAAVSLADPLVEPEAAAALATIETGLAAIDAAATAATTGTSLLSNLQNFAADVPALLTGIAVKNPVLAATINRLVTLVVGECKVLIPAVEAWVAQISTTATPAA
jgi:hypothetical protein